MLQSTKGMRYVVIALLTLTFVLIISTTTDFSQNTYSKAASAFKESSRWTSQRLKGQGWRAEPSTPPVQVSDDVGLKQDAKTAPESDTPSPSSPAPVPDSKPASSHENTTPNPYAGGATLFRGKPSDIPRMNATFVTLARNSDLWELARSIRQVEDRFNWQFGYDWVFLNDQDFDEEFKAITTALTSGRARYGVIPKEHWSYPEWIDQTKAKEVREDMGRRRIIYGDSESYRHMCRYESGFFFRHPLMLEYEWYWRVEPSIELFCDIKYDTFRFMAEHGKKYSFVLSLREYIETIPTLWDSSRKFMQQFPHHVADGNSMEFVSDDGGTTYNKCHFWSNFEIGSLEWLRSDAYIDYFSSLDHDGGFFYERWGDAPVHSIAAAVLLPKDQIHFFEDIAYYHVPLTHCPDEQSVRVEKRCHCNPKDNFDWNGYSCTKKFLQMNGMPLSEIAIKGTRKKRGVRC